MWKVFALALVAIGCSKSATPVEVAPVETVDAAEAVEVAAAVSAADAVSPADAPSAVTP
jgi:hypothetical protein